MQCILKAKHVIGIEDVSQLSLWKPDKPESHLCASKTNEPMQRNGLGVSACGNK
jgi:hypothetical protein